MDCQLARFARAPIVLCCLLSAGCGGDVANDRPQLASVKGKVTQGGMPLAGAQVEFAPEGEGGASMGVTDAMGAFALIYRDGTPGAALGKHRVTVSFGGPTPEQEAALKAQAEGDSSAKPVGRIAPVQTHTEALQVVEGENDFTISFMTRP